MRNIITDILIIIPTFAVMYTFALIRADSCISRYCFLSEKTVGQCHRWTGNPSHPSVCRAEELLMYQRIGVML